MKATFGHNCIDACTQCIFNTGGSQIDIYNLKGHNFKVKKSNLHYDFYCAKKMPEMSSYWNEVENAPNKK